MESILVMEVHPKKSHTCFFYITKKVKVLAIKILIKILLNVKGNVDWYKQAQKTWIQVYLILLVWTVNKLL